METDQSWYKKTIDDRKIGIPTSLITGGLMAASLKYLLHKNKFLSSFRATEKIKDVPYFKFIRAGAIGGVALYELLKRFTKPKKSDDEEENRNLLSRHLGEETDENKMSEEEPKKDFDRIAKVTYICPGSLYSVIGLSNGLTTKTASEIAKIISGDKIKKFQQNYFWFCSSDRKFSFIIGSFLKSSYAAAALYLVNEDQKESFKENFLQECSPYDLYKIKPNSKENLWCYALPLKLDKVYDSHVIEKNFELNIDAAVTKDNIDQYSFQICEEDKNTIDLNAKEIVGIEYTSRNNNN